MQETVHKPPEAAINLATGLLNYWSGKTLATLQKLLNRFDPFIMYFERSSYVHKVLLDMNMHYWGIEIRTDQLTHMWHHNALKHNNYCVVLTPVHEYRARLPQYVVTFIEEEDVMNK